MHGEGLGGERQDTCHDIRLCLRAARPAGSKMLDL